MSKALVVVMLMAGILVGLLIGWFVFGDDSNDQKVFLQTEEDVREFVEEYVEGIVFGDWEYCTKESGEISGVNFLESNPIQIQVFCGDNDEDIVFQITFSQEGKVISGPSRVYVSD